MPRCQRYEFKETLCLIAKNEKRRPYATMTDEQKELFFYHTDVMYDQ